MLPPNNSITIILLKNRYLIFPSSIYYLDEEEIKNKQKRRKSIDSSPMDKKLCLERQIIHW